MIYVSYCSTRIICFLKLLCFSKGDWWEFSCKNLMILVLRNNTKFNYLVKNTKTCKIGEISIIVERSVWRDQRGNQNPWIKEEQTTQWPKEKVQKDKQRSTKHTHKTKDQVTRTPIKTGSEINVKILQLWKLITFDTYLVFFSFR